MVCLKTGMLSHKVRPQPSHVRQALWKGLAESGITLPC
jgi:hypothetical protein